MVRIAGIVFLVLLNASVIEALSLIYFYIETKKVFYLAAAAPEAEQPDNRLDRLNKATGLPGIRLHPIFGWSTEPSTPGYNNEGFYSDRNYPYAANENDFIVGVLGGSVGANFWAYSQRTKAFQTQLKVLVPSLANRNIVLLNLAKDGYKQPQQAIVLSYLLMSGQRFDLVINIEGLNEITSGWVNNNAGLSLAMPGANLLFELSRFTGLENLSEGVIDNLRGKRFELEAEGMPLAAGWLAKRLYAKWLLAKSRTVLESNSKNSANALFIPRGHPVLDRENFLKSYAAFWKQASQITHSIAASAGAPYIDVLHPNQYFQTDRNFTEEEKRSAFVADRGMWSIVQPGYTVMRAEGAGLRKAGIRFVDATSAFDRETDIVYRDNCCHYNDRGEDLLAKFVARETAELLNIAASGR